MITFHYRRENGEIAAGEILLLSKDDPMEMDIHANGWSFHTIVGSHRDGDFICIPNWSIGGELARLRDERWNRERLMNQSSMEKENAAAVASALSALDSWLYKYRKEQ
jgi:hypothetical protein